MYLGSFEGCILDVSALCGVFIREFYGCLGVIFWVFKFYFIGVLGESLGSLEGVLWLSWGAFCGISWDS